jgi:hypothetical protein
MSDTGMTAGPQTQAESVASAIELRTLLGFPTSVSTVTPDPSASGMVTTVSQHQLELKLLIDPSSLAQEREIEEINRSIQRFGRIDRR